jgi:hypothetical protein
MRAGKNTPENQKEFPSNPYGIDKIIIKKFREESVNRFSLIEAPIDKTYWEDFLMMDINLLMELAEKYPEFLVELFSHKYYFKVYYQSMSLCLTCVSLRTKKEIRSCKSNENTKHEILERAHLSTMMKYQNFLKFSSLLFPDTDNDLFTFPSFFSDFYLKKQKIKSCPIIEGLRSNFTNLPEVKKILNAYLIDSKGQKNKEKDANAPIQKNTPPTQKNTPPPQKNHMHLFKYPPSKPGSLIQEVSLFSKSIFLYSIRF